MAKKKGKKLGFKTLSKNNKVIILIAAVIIVAAIISFRLLATSNVIQGPITQGIGQGIGIGGSVQKETCPFECCINDAKYETRVCQGSNYKCINNQCVKEVCPYECCLEGEFSAKLCQADYECQNNRCAAIDTDKDGLTDIEEKQSGTNPNLYDSDGDTLSDYQEVKVSGTNPLNSNTDEDRYSDNIDPEPTNKNSASIQILIANKDFGIDWTNIAILGLTLGGSGAINPDMIIARPQVTINTINNGNDYSTFLSYDVVFLVAKKEIKRFDIQKGRIESHSQLTDKRSFELTLKDIPSILIDLITQKTAEWDVEIQNIRYEKF